MIDDVQPEDYPRGPGRCGLCNHLGLRSTVRGGDGMVSTLMGYSSFFDEEGKHHRHDPNSHGMSFRCSQGHVWSESVVAGCGVRGCPVTTKKTIRYHD